MEITDILFAKSLSGGGGGGSSDFSVAKVTMTNNSQTPFVLSIPNLFDGEMYPTIDSADMDGSDVDCVLYKGSCSAHSNHTVDAETSGSVTVDGNAITITGDGSITFN